jgi:glucose-1-phosphate thymidylyltransferase
VLARGLGTRMRVDDRGAALTAEQQRAADAGQKAMMPINGRPFLDYVLGALADAGIDRAALVVAPDHDALRRYYQHEAIPSRLRVEFVVQPDARGTADAVLAVEPWAAGDDFLVMNADNLYPSTVLRALAALGEPGFPAFDAEDLVRTSNIPADRLASFALVEIGEDGYLRSIVEKPKARQPGGAVSMNVWRFDTHIFGACRDVPKSTRGEFELPEAVGLAVGRGLRLKAIPARGPVLDLSRRADAVEVARRLGETPALPARP